MPICSYLFWLLIHGLIQARGAVSRFLVHPFVAPIHAPIYHDDISGVFGVFRGLYMYNLFLLVLIPKGQDYNIFFQLFLPNFEMQFNTEL